MEVILCWALVALYSLGVGCLCAAQRVVELFDYWRTLLAWSNPVALATSVCRAERGGVVALFSFGATRLFLPHLCTTQRMAEGFGWTRVALCSLGVARWHWLRLCVSQRVLELLHSTRLERPAGLPIL